MNLRAVHLPFWLLTLSYGAAFLAPMLVAEGIFLDGEIYATLARNLAAGQGGPWHPHLSATAHPAWHEHPPLAIWLMSAGYRILGDHLWIERAYSLLTFLVSGWLVLAIWRRLLRDDPALVRLGWLPVLLWLMNPQVPWSYANAMLENTMAVFVLAAVLCVVRARERDGIAWRWMIAAGAAVFLAFLTKGPVGLFPLAAPVLAALVTGRPRPVRAGAETLLMLATLAVLGALLWMWPTAREGLSQYFEQQVVASLDGSRGGDSNVLDFAADLIEALLPAIGLTLLLVVLTRRRTGWSPFAGPHPRTALGFVLLGLAGTLPLGLSPRQSLFYGVPAFPFFALGLALLAAPAAAALTAALKPGSRAHRAWATVAVAVLVAVLAWTGTRVGTYARDSELRRDVKLMVAHLDTLDTLDPPDPGPERVVALCGDLWKNWGLQSALRRYGNIAPDRDGGLHGFLVSRESCDVPPLDVWTRVPLATTAFHLYEHDVGD